MIVQEVSDKSTEKAFLDLPRKLYKADPNFVSALDQDVQAIFDPEKNAVFKDGEAMRWILLDDKNQVIGRVAAFYVKTYFKEGHPKLGGMGFFECINNQDAANLLFQTATDYIKSKSLDGFQAPINFGEKDKFWGLMVQGFKNPSYQENYNPPYYQQLYENFGFQKVTEQTTSEIEYANFNYDRFSKLASRVLKNPNYTFEHYKAAELSKFAADFISIYNQAWANREDFVPMTMPRIESTLRSLKPIMMEEIIWFAYANGDPAGFYISVLDVNQIFRYVNGKLNLIGKLKFVWYRHFGELTRVRGIVFGVIPKYQNLGLETGMIMKFYDEITKRKKMRTAELAWIGDFNPKMHSLFHSLGAQTTKIHYTYKYLFHSQVNKNL